MDGDSLPGHGELSRDISTCSELLIDHTASERGTDGDAVSPEVVTPPEFTPTAHAAPEHPPAGEGLVVWKQHKRHQFVFTVAGKPVYSKHGNDLEQSHLMGIAQALVLTSADIGDTLRSVTCGAWKLVITTKPGVTLVAASSAGDTVQHMRQQLEFLYGQILFLLTNKPLLTLQTMPSYDLRGVLGGTSSMLDGIGHTARRGMSVCWGATPTLPLSSAARSRATLALNTLRVSDALYAILLAGDEIVAYVQPKAKEFALQPFDIILLSNFIQSSSTLRQAETWTPVCLPKFRPDGMLHAYIACVGTVVSSVAPVVSAASLTFRCPTASPGPRIRSVASTTEVETPSGAGLLSPGASVEAAYSAVAAASSPTTTITQSSDTSRHHTGIFLVLISANTAPAHLAELARGKNAIVASLAGSALLRDIARSMGRKRYSTAEFEIPGLVHFAWLWTPQSQYTMPNYPASYTKTQRKELLAWYWETYAHLTSPFPPLKQSVHRKPCGVMTGLLKDDYCLLAVFEAGVQSGTAAVDAERLLKKLRGDKDRWFTIASNW